ncbi:MAG: hypothetical protein BMS9Abin06_0663 [Gammaproteobacteria bacterium]|nr:MAG: hypothetical protein BMS9Abin06_0663 [Gammaproteobacteria bacterium]
MPRRYSLAVQLFSMAAFSVAFFGWLNEAWLFWFENPIWLNRYTEYGIILGFGIWRILAEQNPYTRRRFIILVFMVTVFWWLIPWLYPVYESYVGFLWAQPVFPSLHVPGTLTFFLVLGLVFLFGRRIICGFGCPCVGIRETVGFPFRKKTLRSKWTWRLRHSKWFFFAWYVGIMAVTQFPPNSWTVSFVGSFYLIVMMTYFGTFFLAPLVGNRFYCRYLCPYGATFGLLNHAGFYAIKMDKDKCNDCRRCEQVCDMGIPVWEQGKQAGRVTALEDCMGCARCVVSCPTDALEIRDVRNLFRPKRVQNASYLLKRKQPEPLLRQEPRQRPPVERLGDWTETTTLPGLAKIQAQAARCLDCGVPGCINACPLSNRIPEWLEAVAAGEIEIAAGISQATSNLPEICGSLCPQHRLCEGSCTKAKEPDGAITIGAIERYLTDAAFKQGWQPHYAVRRNGKHIAIVGAGPAGLACADQLNKAGCDVTVFDKQPVIGGLLASGVPPFKLDKALLDRRHQLLEQQGVHFRLSEEVDEALLDQLLRTHDAIFMGTGTQTSRDLKLPGQQLTGVTDALSYLQQVNRDTESAAMVNKHVLVIGAGDTAMDCARSALRQGAASVTVAYRREEQAMRTTPREKQAALEEGVVFRMERVPTQMLGDEAVSGVRFNTPDGGQETIACDAVILAVGQVPRPPAWLERFDVQTDEQGIIRVDENGKTSNAKIYAGGDNTHGPDLVVTAIAAGRQAAHGIFNSFRPTRIAQESIRSLLRPPEKQPEPELVAVRTAQ